MRIASVASSVPSRSRSARLTAFSFSESSMPPLMRKYKCCRRHGVVPVVITNAGCSRFSFRTASMRSASPAPVELGPGAACGQKVFGPCTALLGDRAVPQACANITVVAARRTHFDKVHDGLDMKRGEPSRCDKRLVRGAIHDLDLRVGEVRAWALPRAQETPHVEVRLLVHLPFSANFQRIHSLPTYPQSSNVSTVL
jgi:hypothetical protein